MLPLPGATSQAVQEMAGQALQRRLGTPESCNLKGGPLKHLPYMGRHCHCRVFDLKIIYLMISPWEQLAERD